MYNAAPRFSAVGSGAALELRGVTRMFGALAALTDVTITVRPGERRAVLGSNGAGKTTLFNCVTGDFPPSSGTIRFFGEDITHFPPYERIRRGFWRAASRKQTNVPKQDPLVAVQQVVAPGDRGRERAVPRWRVADWGQPVTIGGGVTSMR